MREIKFRAWDLVTKTIQEVPNIFYNCGEKLTMVNMVTNRRFEFMQFTGLKDSKGKEIYEGDIVSWKEEGAIGEWLVGIVKWEEDRFIAERVNSPLWVYEGITCRSYAIKGEFYAEYRIPSFEWDELEIIGNIYENPELLKEVENEFL